MSRPRQPIPRKPPASGSKRSPPPAAGAPSGTYARLLTGDPAPSFVQATPQNPRFASQTLGGLYTVLLFHVSAADPLGRAALEAAAKRLDLFDARRATCFAVALDRGDESRLGAVAPGVGAFWDFDGEVAKLYGALPLDWTPEKPVKARRQWVIVDPQLRVHAVVPFRDDGGDAAEGLPPDRAGAAGRPYRRFRDAGARPGDPPVCSSPSCARRWSPTIARRGASRRASCARWMAER